MCLSGITRMLCDGDHSREDLFEKSNDFFVIRIRKARLFSMTALVSFDQSFRMVSKTHLIHVLDIQQQLHQALQ